MQPDAPQPIHPGKPAAFLPVGFESGTALGMTAAAAAFLASLTQDQQVLYLLPLGDEERLNWDYLPHPRRGLSLQMMHSQQQKLALGLGEGGLNGQCFSCNIDLPLAARFCRNTRGDLDMSLWKY